MATIRSSLPHTERTAAEPRENRREPVVLSHIRQVNDSIRLLKLQAVDKQHTIKVIPGQWLDTFIPGLQQAGGFTITSTPQDAMPSTHSSPYLELAVQRSSNPPAQWLWRDTEEIISTQLTVRVGGSFTWPPPHLDTQGIDRLVLIAGGVGINPLISIFTYLIRTPAPLRPPEIHFVYTTKAEPDLDPQRILFLPRLMDLVAAAADPANVTLSCFLTGVGDDGYIEHGKLPNRTFARRIADHDLLKALDGYKASVFGAEHDRKNTVCYVCGPPQFTDVQVQFLRSQAGMSEDRVLIEKWW
ncbi:uncharacterized protein MYCFIDRAFT_185089 [Pseudocercospora fijiensis CIRAD86]|uniref:FAD-binding FR-type domain-containing protein n=1 Tax=Pseudocercospora fijiensis (strain CIRAD86) TaxID=383855 RepID=N1QBA2_PSEFD|nr:uncharacterized protein MYCFIDRAFT_185089 [Pseudocercospora fijiensis CIRAD86]EME88378.1 hypothetical protein MYCFIDRAFT_185089 [Pseudocercospora fijiensis CIRAD86]